MRAIIIISVLLIASVLFGQDMLVESIDTDNPERTFPVSDIDGSRVECPPDPPKHGDAEAGENAESMEEPVKATPVTEDGTPIPWEEVQKDRKRENVDNTPRERGKPEKAYPITEDGRIIRDEPGDPPKLFEPDSAPDSEQNEPCKHQDSAPDAVPEQK